MHMLAALELEEQKRSAEREELVRLRARVTELLGANNAYLERARTAESERDAMAADIVAAAGLLMVEIPEPGTDMARVMRANSQMRRERDAARAERADAMAEIRRLNERYIEMGDRCADALVERNAAQKERDEARAAALEEAARVAEGWPTTAAGDEYMTCGNGEFWDAGTPYDQARHDAAAAIRALAAKGGGDE